MADNTFTIYITGLAYENSIEKWIENNLTINILRQIPPQYTTIRFIYSDPSGTPEAFALLQGYDMSLTSMGRDIESIFMEKATINFNDLVGAKHCLIIDSAHLFYHSMEGCVYEPGHDYHKQHAYNERPLKLSAVYLGLIPEEYNDDYWRSNQSKNGMDRFIPIKIADKHFFDVDPDGDIETYADKMRHLGYPSDEEYALDQIVIILKEHVKKEFAAFKIREGWAGLGLAAKDSGEIAFKKRYAAENSDLPDSILHDIMSNVPRAATLARLGLGGAAGGRRAKAACTKKVPYNKKVKRSPFKTLKRAKAAERSFYQGKEIGFTARSSLKSMGRIKRASGCYELGSKYR
jgi:hypothetical protein